MTAPKMDVDKIRREYARWLILLVLNNGRPQAIPEGWILSTIQAEICDATALELRRSLDYLEDRKLVKIDRRPDGRWLAELTRYGVDIAEYTIDCEPGIARPQKYW